MIFTSRAASAARWHLTYLLPLRRYAHDPDVELANYLAWLTRCPGLEVIVVDGSAPPIFAAHRRTWVAAVRHLPVVPELATANGKVGGVMTGLWAARHEAVVIADDDVRYDTDRLARVAELLERFDAVRPQCYFDPLDLGARVDTARSLINRAFGHDYPGTLGVRRSSVLTVGGYDGDVLFENRELLRTIAVAGGTIANRRSLYVRRLPAPPAHFRVQRARHAYESFAQPLRCAVELALLPALVMSLVRRRGRTLAQCVALTAAVAEIGRRRAGGARFFPASASLLAPMWVLERAVFAWVALWLRIARGGVGYGQTRIAVAGSSTRRLRRRVRPLAAATRG